MAGLLLVTSFKCMFLEGLFRKVNIVIGDKWLFPFKNTVFFNFTILNLLNSLN